MRYYRLRPEGLIPESVFFHCSKAADVNDAMFLDTSQIFEFTIVKNPDTTAGPRPGISAPWTVDGGIGSIPSRDSRHGDRPQHMTTLLAADIGGTKCELAVFALAGDDCRPLASRRYPSRDHAGIEEIIARFLGECGLRPRFACLAVAGVTGKDKATVTNLPWIIEAKRLEAAFGFAGVVLLNDLTAVCGLDPHSRG